VDNALCDVGMVGLGVMGRSLALNLAEHGHSVCGYDKDAAKGRALVEEGAGKPVAFADGPAAFVQRLRPPRVIVLLVAPAPVVDAVLRDLLPHVAAGDLIIDAGNSYFKDTDRRGQALAEKGVRFFGMGVSGGEAGARHGPSLMPGGPRDAYDRVRPMLEAVAARAAGEPCVAWVGNGSAGHYVKMVHNGIEYGLMQLLAESYDLLKRGLGLHNDALHSVYDGWSKGELSSFLVEITARLFLKEDDLGEGRLVDKVLGVARQKGTGQWTSQEALDLHVPIPTIDAAVSARNLSGCDKERAAAAAALKGPAPSFSGDRNVLLHQLEGAMQAAMLITYAQGLGLLRVASRHYGYGISLADVARIWRAGSIIRAALLEDVRAAFAENAELPNLLLAPKPAATARARQGDLRAVVKAGIGLGLPVPALAASLAYFDGLRSGWLPANLIQAQRDSFGAHTYERTDRPGTFHSHWDGP
jgi:6-phosphogluconate dehydrogenase